MNAEPDSFEQLVAYVLGELDDGVAHAIEARLQRSPETAATVESLRDIIGSFENTTDPPPDLVKHVVAEFRQRAPDKLQRWLHDATMVLAQLVFDSRSQPALAGFRGDDDSYQLSYESTIGLVDLDVARSASSSTSGWRLRGQIDDNTQCAGASVTLLHAGTEEPVLETEANDRGYFAMRAGPGVYDLRITLPARTLVLSELALE